MREPIKLVMCSNVLALSCLELPCSYKPVIEINGSTNLSNNQHFRNLEWGTWKKNAAAASAERSL